MKLLLFSILVLTQLSINGQITYPSIPKKKIMILGTFHFISNNDGIKYEKENMHSEKRQAEITDINNRLAKFNPDKIFIEWRPIHQNYVDSSFNAYRIGKLLFDSHIKYTHEIYQIGYKLAEILKLPTLYCMDAPGLYKADTVNVTAKKYGQYEAYNQYFHTKSKELIYEDSIWKFEPLRDILLVINSNKKLLESHYLNAGLTTAPYIGPVGDYAAAEFMGEWYKRNLRMFSNIVRQLKQEDDTILVIVGAGHAHLLRQFFSDSPQFELIEVNQYLK